MKFINRKKLAAGIATGALMLGLATPAAFANYNHSGHQTGGYQTQNHNSYGFHSHKHFTDLQGEEEVPGPGDPDGFGYTKVKVNHESGEVCVKIRVYNIEPATAAHIHDGNVGETGPVVATLPTPDAWGRASGCVVVSTDLAQNIADHPSDFYVNVHNAPHPDGALRGQL